jgi:hypothetical protein
VLVDPDLGGGNSDKFMPDHVKLILVPFLCLCLLLTPVLMLQDLKLLITVPVHLCLTVFQLQFHLGEITTFGKLSILTYLLTKLGSLQYILKNH